MKLINDKRATDIMYVDKINLQHANDNQIMKLINSGSFDAKRNIIECIGYINGLDKDSINLIYIINNMPVCSTVGKVFEEYERIIKKSRSSFDRLMRTLRNKGIIRVNDREQILLSETYALRNVTNKVKYIIIELNPDETSSGIDI